MRLGDLLISLHGLDYYAPYHFACRLSESQLTKYATPLGIILSLGRIYIFYFSLSFLAFSLGICLRPMGEPEVGVDGIHGLLVGVDRAIIAELREIANVRVNFVQIFKF